MTTVLKALFAEIEEKIQPKQINIMRIEGMESPILYAEICKNFTKSATIEIFMPKLAMEAYQYFIAQKQASWAHALQYLHQGDNFTAQEQVDAPYRNDSYIDFDAAITKWRNVAADFPNGTTVLVLLMGTEMVADQGGLEDFLCISPKELVSQLQSDYSIWFEDIFTQSGFETANIAPAIHTLYQAIFTHINIDIFKFGHFIDQMETFEFTTEQQVIDHICQTLHATWGIPSIVQADAIPRLRALCGGKRNSTRIITEGAKFYQRHSDKFSEADERRMCAKFDRYLEEKELDATAPFPADTQQFTNYRAFQACMLEFMKGKHLEQNRKTLLQMDYSIISRILGMSEKRTKAPTTQTITGAPMEAYAKMFLLTVAQFLVKYKDTAPTTISVTVSKIALSNCTEQTVEAAYVQICSFLGGILHFFNDASIQSGDTVLQFAYNQSDFDDPFDAANYALCKDMLRANGKWGDAHAITMSVQVTNQVEQVNATYKWSFSPYCAWNHAFSYLTNLASREEEIWEPPTLVACHNMQDYLFCEGEDVFYAHLEQLRETLLFDAHRAAIHAYFQDQAVSGMFDLLCCNFRDFIKQLTQHGLFNAMAELRKVVDSYSKLMEEIWQNYNNYTSIQREKLPLLLHCFTITANADFLNTCDIAQALLPAYHPAMLEKMDAQQIFLRDGFVELMAEQLDANEVLSKSMIAHEIGRFVQLSTITAGVDALYCKKPGYLPCEKMWQYYGVYYKSLENLQAVSLNSSALIEEDDDALALSSVTPHAQIIVRNVMDYLHTFPARADGLQLAFFNPIDMQHIVSAVHAISRQLEREQTPAVLHMRLICFNSKKNATAYLKKWLDNYFADEKMVQLQTQLQYLTINSVSDMAVLEKEFRHCDLGFVYQLLEPSGISFHPVEVTATDYNQTKFPMAFTPDTLSARPGNDRKVNLSQFQFLAAKAHTQATHIIGEPNSREGAYRACEGLELRDIQRKLLSILHKNCQWVVCIDLALDRKMLESHDGKIIGFTTGEGNYGELNVTVSARHDTLQEITHMLRNRLHEKFPNWEKARLQQATDFCVQDLCEHMDGGCILKALNPYDYQIHNFLAYALMVQILKINQAPDGHLLRALINLDAYQHWFVQDGLDSRPDFMLIEIPMTAENLSDNHLLQLHMQMIECKMGAQSDDKIEKAILQLENGLQTMMGHWNPQAKDVRHRYWLNQLYRAIIFSPLHMDSNHPAYSILQNKLYNILNGQIDITWAGDVYAFWLNQPDDVEEVYSVDCAIETPQTAVNTLQVHTMGQLYIQKMLVPVQQRQQAFAFNPPEEDGVEDDVACTQPAPERETTPQVAPVVAVPEPIQPPIPPAPEPVPEPIPQPTEPVPPVATGVAGVRLLLGEDLRTKEKYYWEFGNKDLNNRHLLINGNSGCGKTYCIQGLLLESALQGISSVVFDYTGGFTSSKLDPFFKEKLQNRIQQRVIRMDKIPINPFKRHEIQLDEDILIPECNEDIASKMGEILSAVYRLGDQQKSAIYTAVLSGMRMYGEAMHFADMAEELEKQETSYAKTVLSKIQQFIDMDPFHAQADFAWSDIRDSGGTVYVMQLAGYSRDVQILLTELMLWDIWGFSVKSGDESKPFVLVLDEAQNLNHGEKSPSARILTEGRKFGISAWYATQFMKPQLTNDEIQRLQQAGQKLYFCPPDEGVVTIAKSIDITAAGAAGWADRLKKLKKGECVTCGNLARNGKLIKYDPKIIKITSLQERMP